MKKAIIFIDSGETIIQELSQVFDDNGVITDGTFLPTAFETILTLHESGHEIVLVADGKTSTFENIYSKNGLKSIFKAMIDSESVGVDKPDKAMFEAAFNTLGLKEEEKERILMVGNNLYCDILGANNFGITSVFLRWTTRDIYSKTPSSKEDTPDYTIDLPIELINVVNDFEKNLNK